MKNLYVGVETTGLNPQEDDIIRIAMLVEEDGVIKNTFRQNHIKPRAGRLPSSISKESLAINGIKLEDLRNGTDPARSAYGIINFLKENSNNGKSRLRLVTYNLKFTLAFLANFIKANTEYSFTNYLSNRPLNMKEILPFVEISTGYQFKDAKFRTVCNYYGIQFTDGGTESKVEAIRLLTEAMAKSIKMGEIPEDSHTLTDREQWECDQCSD